MGFLDRDLFFQIRNECCNARTREDFNSIIEFYNLDPRVGGALEGVQIDHSMGEVVSSHFSAFMGLFLGGFGGIKEATSRQLNWHVPTLVAALNAGSSLPVTAVV